MACLLLGQLAARRKQCYLFRHWAFVRQSKLQACSPCFAHAVVADRAGMKKAKRLAVGCSQLPAACIRKRCIVFKIRVSLESVVRRDSLT